VVSLAENNFLVALSCFTGLKIGVFSGTGNTGLGMISRPRDAILVSGGMEVGVLERGWCIGFV
jgi:hypothetical protein